MVEEWRGIAGYESRYEISSKGRIRSVSFLQRYLLRNGVPAYRVTKPKEIATQAINSGYLIVHLHLDGVRKARLVHRLVAATFCGTPAREVNHKDGDKTNNSAPNLEWVSSKENHLHAVSIGLNPLAIPVIDPQTGVRYNSITQAAKQAHRSHRSVRKMFGRAAA